MVFYRKYRPQSLEDLVGQTSVKQALKSAFASQKLAHAYLFCGPRGTGKTSTARILAKMVNCEKSSVVSRQSSDKTSESLKAGSETILKADSSIPCNQCPSCLTITDGSNLDVIEMDAASNRGIEDIRNLRENIKLSPSGAKKKVYIIDEVHMLSGDAFNALLKTLEEPPSHVLFILATTEVQKIPQTILSRVQRLDFKPAKIEELTEDLNNIAKKEKMEISEEALLSIAKKAQGSFRDAEKILDQLSSLGKIDKQIIEENLGLGNPQQIGKLLEFISQGDAKEALQSLTAQFESGVNFKELNLAILDNLRHLLLLKNGLGDQLVKPEVGEDEYEVLKSLVQKFALEKLLFALECFQKSLEQSRFVSIPTLPLEVAVVEAAGRPEDRKIKISEDQIKLDKSENQKANEPEKIEEKKGAISDTPIDQNTDTPKSDSSQASLILSGTTDSSDIQKLQERWVYVLETVKQYNFSLEALLRMAKLSDGGVGNIQIEVPYAFHQRILEAPKNRDLLESVFGEILGRPLKVSTTLGQRPSSRDDIANVEIAADDELVRLAADIFNSEPVN